MNRRRFTNRQILLAATALCVVLIAVSFFETSEILPLRFVANYTVVPMEKGINRIGTWISNRSENFRSMRELQRENEELRAQVDALTAENDTLKLDYYELERLSALYEIDRQYESYEKTGANVIGSDAGNWFNRFMIDKGTNDGIQTGMNVIAAGGLVGIVIDTGPNWAVVRSIIDDNSEVSAMTATTSDICYVSGDLEAMSGGTIPFTDMENNDNDVRVGDEIVTSHVSSKFLPGITVGHVSEVHVDSNNLTRSGMITPAVDFRHLREVLVILDMKETGEEKE